MRNSLITQVLYTTLFIVLPTILGFLFFSPDWGKDKTDTWKYWVGVFGFWIYIMLISYIFIYFKIIDIAILNIWIPLSLVFSIIFVSYDWHIAARIVSVILSVILALPINIFINWIQSKK